MARTIPALPRPGSSPVAVRLLDAWRTRLPEPWTVVQGAAWVGKCATSEPLRDGALDFVLAHPEYGLLGLVVLPGALGHDPSGPSWSVTARDGRPQRIVDPFAAAHDGMAALLHKLAQHPLAVPSRPAGGHGVLLPEAFAPKAGFAAHAPADIVLDRAALQDPVQAVLGLFDRWQRRAPATGNASSRWWWRALEDLFLQPQQARMLLANALDDDAAAMVALSPQQLGVLDMLARVRRQAIYGAAGTGKTVLAMHKARALAAQGMRVLLTCYNKELGHQLHRALADTPNVVAWHFHELCYELAGLDRRRTKAPSSDARARFFDHELASHLLTAAHRDGARFDALVVDEAQDFIAPWWQALHAWLVDPDRGVRYVFFDDAQCLRADAAPVPGGDEALVLTTNWRNTAAIHRHLTQNTPHMRQAQCIAPEGSPVTVEPMRPNAGRALRRVLQRVCAEGGVAPADVVVLTARAPQKSIWRDFAEVLLPWKLTAGDEPGHVRLRGIRAFKGMEAKVVILTELDGEPAETRLLLHYIGGSRATGLLVLLPDP